MTAELVQQALHAPNAVAVRRRLFRQLLESLLYEGSIRTRTDEAGRTVVDGRDERGAPVRYAFRARRRHGFDRVALDPAPVRREAGDRHAEADSLTRFLGEVRAALDAAPERLAAFARELEETLVKDALAQHVRAQRGDRLAGATHDALEATIADGHRYHPSYKSRIGFDVADNLAFGPEFAQPIRPLWLAARRGLTELTHSDALDERALLRTQLGEAVHDEFEARAGADYAMLPVHPWQWRERIARTFAPQLRRRDLIVLGDDPHAFRAQQSIRTLACIDRPRRPYLKLALSIVNTSTSRVLAPHTVRNAPRISDWLAGIAARDPFLRDELGTILLAEPMGAAFVPPPPADLTRDDGYGALACIWRESLHERLAPGEGAVPFNGLTARELDGTPLIDPWIRTQGIEPWLERVVAASAIPLVHLLCHHGIAVESHAQNMLLVHRDGVPARVALRDFHDGVRFARARLAEPDRCPALAAPPAHHGNRNSFVETDDPELVADFMLDAFLFVNLGELAILLADAYGLDERAFWALAADAIHAYLRRFPEPRFDPFKPTIAIEKLATRRLLPDTELRLHAVPNPLVGRPQTFDRK